MVKLLGNDLILSDGVMKSAARKFADAFDRAWAAIPDEAKGVIREYFRRHPGWVYMCFTMDAANHPREPWGRCSYGDGRTVLTFLAPVFDLVATTGALDSVIVHELAHIFRRGSGSWTADEDAEETAVRVITKSWGFEDYGVGDWKEFHRQVEGWRKANRKRFGKFTEARWVKLAKP